MYLWYEQLTDALLQVRQTFSLVQNIILQPLESCFFLGVCDLQDRNLTFHMWKRVCSDFKPQNLKESVFITDRLRQKLLEKPSALRWQTRQ